MWNMSDYYPRLVAQFVGMDTIDVQVVRDDVAAGNVQRIAVIIDNDVRSFEIDRLTGVVSEITPFEDAPAPEPVSDAERILRLAEALAPYEASELIDKMYSGNIKGVSLRILHSYVKNQLTRIVHARRIDREELLRWVAIDADVERLLAQVYLF